MIPVANQDFVFWFKSTLKRDFLPRDCGWVIYVEEKLTLPDVLVDIRLDEEILCMASFMSMELPTGSLKAE